MISIRSIILAPLETRLYLHKLFLSTLETRFYLHKLFLAPLETRFYLHKLFHTFSRNLRDRFYLHKLFSHPSRPHSIYTNVFSLPFGPTCIYSYTNVISQLLWTCFLLYSCTTTMQSSNQAFRAKPLAKPIQPRGSVSYYYMYTSAARSFARLE